MEKLNSILYTLISYPDIFLLEDINKKLSEEERFLLSRKLDNFHYLNEFTSKDFLDGAEKKRKKRAKTQFEKHGTKFSTTLKDGTIVFKTKSAGYDNPNYSGYHKTYFQYIYPVDIKDVKEMKDLKDRDKVNLLLAGNLKVRCTCPDFLYFGNKYILTQLDAIQGDEKEHRFPKIKNPDLKGTGLCKHLIVALEVLPFWISEITSKYKKLNLL